MSLGKKNIGESLILEAIMINYMIGSWVVNHLVYKI